MKKKFGLFVIISLIPVVVLSCALLGSLDDPLAFTKNAIDAAAPRSLLKMRKSII